MTCVAIFVFAGAFYLLSFVELIIFYVAEEEDDQTLDQLLTTTRAAYSARRTGCSKARWVFQSVFYVMYLLFLGTVCAYFTLVLVSDSFLSISQILLLLTHLS